MTKRQVVAARFRKAIKDGSVEAFKLAMLIDQDPASEEPIDRETQCKLDWKKLPNLFEDIWPRGAEARGSDQSPSRQPSAPESPSAGDAVALDPDEIADEEGDDEQA